jgi:CheY-like chemotaxis protein
MTQENKIREDKGILEGRLKVLVVDDESKQREAAKEQIGFVHNLILAENYAEAVCKLTSEKPDVLMTDLNFPFGNKYPLKDCQKEEISEPRPLGYALALFAARPSIAVPRIAIYTDGNHHTDAISATFDQFMQYTYKDFEGNHHFHEDESFEGKRPILKVNDSLLVMYDRNFEPSYTEPFFDKDVINAIDDYIFDKPWNSGYRGKFEEWLSSVEVKNWEGVLRTVIQEPTSFKGKDPKEFFGS